MYNKLKSAMIEESKYLETFQRVGGRCKPIGVGY